MWVMFVQSYELQGRCFTNLHYFYCDIVPSICKYIKNFIQRQLSVSLDINFQCVVSKSEMILHHFMTFSFGMEYLHSVTSAK